MDLSRSKKIFFNVPMLETPRLILRKISMDDLYDMNRYSVLDETSKYLVWTPHLNLAETRGNIEFHINQ